MADVQRLSAAQARRTVLAAQGFTDPRPGGKITVRHLRRVLDRVGLLQIDSVNVLSRSHYLPVFARLGPYPRDLLDRYCWGPKAELFEYWAHAASLVPVGLQPYLRWRMARAAQDAWPGIARIGRENPGFVEEVLELVRDSGPIGGGAVEVERPAKRPGEMWNWHDGKIALEWLFFTGAITTAARPNFERKYDLTERVLPPGVLAEPTPAEPDAIRELVRVAARCCGVATERDLRDYFRLPAKSTRPALAELIETGELAQVTVAGWTEPGYLWTAAKMPRRVAARALLSPFDSLIWERDRTERLFGFRYRIGIYTPAAKREDGYYVLPFLLGDRLVGRVDLKADRQAGVLRVQAAGIEDWADPFEVATELATELTLMSTWLGLTAVTVADRGLLARPLQAALTAAA